MSNQEGRLLGLIGGLGPSATIYYYRGLLAAHAVQGRVARILIAHADVDHERLRDLARTLIKRDGAESALLAGTDLSMVLNEENAGFPTLDCAAVHIAAITKRLLS